MRDISQQPLRKTYEGEVSTVSVIGSARSRRVHITIEFNGGPPVTTTPEIFDQLAHELAAANHRVQQAARKITRTLANGEAAVPEPKEAPA